MDTRDKIIEMLMNKFGWERSEIESIDDFEQLGMDSLSLYSLVTDIEEELNISIDTDDITEINTPSKIISYVDNKLKG